MNNTKRKKLYRINLASQKSEVIVPEIVQNVEPIEEKVEKQLPVALKDEPVQVAVQEEVQEESVSEELVEENKEVKKNVLPRFKKYKKDVEVGE